MAYLDLVRHPLLLHARARARVEAGVIVLGVDAPLAHWLGDVKSGRAQMWLQLWLAKNVPAAPGRLQDGSRMAPWSKMV